MRLVIFSNKWMTLCYVMLRIRSSGNQSQRRRWSCDKSHLGKKNRRDPSSNWYEIDKKNAVLNLAIYCGAIWRHREIPQYRCTTTIHPVYNGSKKDFWKFTSCRAFGAHKLVHSELFLDYFYEIWHLLSALGSDVRKEIYIGAHLWSRP